MDGSHVFPHPGSRLVDRVFWHRVRAVRDKHCDAWVEQTHHWLASAGHVPRLLHCVFGTRSCKRGCVVRCTKLSRQQLLDISFGVVRGPDWELKIVVIIERMHRATGGI